MKPNLDSKAVQNVVISHALTLGLFRNVSGHEPKSAPGLSLNAAVFLSGIAPVPQMSGLSSTSARLEFTVRVYNPMVEEPQDDIDPTVLDATAELIGVYTGDLDLGLSNMWGVDVLGAYGTSLRGVAGYFNQDNRIYRAMAITLPLILNDVWTQET